MTKLTSRDLSLANFEAWSQIPWFRTFLQNEIDVADEVLASLGQTACFGPCEGVDAARLEAAAMAGRKSSLELLLELEYSDVVEGDDEEA